MHFSTSEASTSGPATIQTSSVDAIPTEHTVITTTSDRKTSTTTPAKQYDAPARVSSRSNKGGMTFLKHCHYPYDIQLLGVDHIWSLKLFMFQVLCP